MSNINNNIDRDELKIAGYGFINKNIEILCIKTVDRLKILYLTPWRSADPSEVIISWDSNISSLTPLLGSVPFLDTGNIDFSELEPIAVSINKEKTAIWIG